MALDNERYDNEDYAMLLGTSIPVFPVCVATRE